MQKETPTKKAIETLRSKFGRFYFGHGERDVEYGPENKDRLIASDEYEKEVEKHLLQSQLSLIQEMANGWDIPDPICNIHKSMEDDCGPCGHDAALGRILLRLNHYFSTRASEIEEELSKLNE